MKRAGASLALGLAVALGSTRAYAADDCPRPGAWIRVRFDGAAFGQALRARVVEHLAADLGEHGVTPCADPVATDGASPVAELALALSSARVLTLEVDDPVTRKKLAREIPLGGVPPDALAPAVALAAEELLRASWIEAALAPQSPPAPRVVELPLPAEVREANADELSRMPRARPAELALLAAGDRAGGGVSALGSDLRFEWGERWAAFATVGFRAGIDVARADGTVRERDARFGLGVAYASAPREAPFGVGARLRASLLDVTFSGDPAPGARGMSGSALGVVVAGAAGAWASLGPRWRVVSEASVGAPVRPVTASDSGAPAVGISGVQLGVALGVGVSL